ncbi:hypothetical protein [Maricaulis sp.]|uniref:hypothetical protein n=1 Tax=Maricaulis sp. TaxID=1486257 RepID=UPI003A8E6D6E
MTSSSQAIEAELQPGERVEWAGRPQLLYVAGAFGMRLIYLLCMVALGLVGGLTAYIQVLAPAADGLANSGLAPPLDYVIAFIIGVFLLMGHRPCFRCPDW